MRRCLLAVTALAGCWTSAPPAPTPAPAVVGEPEILPGGPFATRPLRGPYAQLSRWCHDVTGRSRDPSAGCLGPLATVTRGPVRAGPSGNAGGTAIRDAFLVAFQVEPDPNWGPRCALVLDTARGLWIHEDVESCPGGGIVRSVVVDELAWHDVVDEAPGRELVLRVSRVRASGGGGDVSSTNMLVCGTGPRGEPHCTPPIPVSSIGVAQRIAYHPTISPAGELRFQADDGDGNLTVDKRFLRRHPLRFP